MSWRKYHNKGTRVCVCGRGHECVFLFVVLFFVGVFCGGCSHYSEPNFLRHEAYIDKDSIVRRGVLRAVTDYNSVNYFVYKGEAVGYQYELLKQYAKHLGVELEIVADNSLNSGYEKLSCGDVDILASSLIADSALIPSVALCEPYGESGIVLVSNVDSLATLREVDTVYCMAQSFYSRILEEYNDTAEREIVVVPIEHYDAEQLVSLVGEREIKATICLENIARANKWYYDSLKLGEKVCENQELAWGVRQTSVELQADISQWMKGFKKTSTFKKIYRKYVIDPREHHGTTQNIKGDTYNDIYEEEIKSIAVDKRYNWILISSVIYQESRFNNNARSWAGASGLMQLMPETAARFGVDDTSDPVQSIRAGYEYLLWLDNRLVGLVPDSRERVKFVLASYNVGLGHVMDAIRLAEKLGKDSQVWTDCVETCLLLKANPKYYSDPVVKYGFCRGTETVAYVKNVLDRYGNYRKRLRG